MSTSTEAKTLNDLLDELFEAVRLKDAKIAPTTSGEQARFAGLSPSHWSRLRNGKVPITPAVARTIMISFEKILGHNPPLLHQLLHAPQTIVKEAPKIYPAEQTIAALFDRISQPRATLFISCLAPLLDVHLSSTGHFIIKAIKAGMRLVLTQPFGPYEELRQRFASAAWAASATWEYRYRTAYKLREFFNGFNEVCKEFKKFELRDRVILLEPTVISPNAGFMLGSQLMYVEYNPGHEYDSKAEMFYLTQHARQVERLIEFTQAAYIGEAIYEEFAPISRAWRKSGCAADFRLPQSTEELNTLDADQPWTVVSPDP